MSSFVNTGRATQQNRDGDEMNATRSDANMVANIPANGSTTSHCRQLPQLRTSRPECTRHGEEMTTDVALRTNTESVTVYRQPVETTTGCTSFFDSLARYIPFISRTTKQDYEAKRQVDLLEAYVRHDKQKLDDEERSLRAESEKLDRKMEEDLREQKRRLKERADARKAELEKLAVTLGGERQQKVAEVGASLEEEKKNKARQHMLREDS
jgi:hypothetical protein